MQVDSIQNKKNYRYVRNETIVSIFVIDSNGDRINLT